jgi:choline dehydrogenase-like flavoprotein
MPSVPSANTSAAAFMIGEKAADALAEPQRVPEVKLALAL